MKRPLLDEVMKYILVCSIVSCHVVFDNPHWAIQLVQIVFTLVCADSILYTARMSTFTSYYLVY